MVLRAVGHKQSVCILQFIKQRRDTGELAALSHLPKVETHVCGQGFVRSGQDAAARQAHVSAAQEGLLLAAEKLRDPTLAMVVLDEICGAMAAGLLTIASVREALAQATGPKIIILTGREAAPELIELADTVSCIACVKHGWEQGWAAQKGVEL